MIKAGKVRNQTPKLRRRPRLPTSPKMRNHTEYVKHLKNRLYTLLSGSRYMKKGEFNSKLLEIHGEATRAGVSSVINRFYTRILKIESKGGLKRKYARRKNRR